MDPLLASYEAAPYDSQPIAHADVSSLETMAFLHGLRSAPADCSRVLELGCASGEHLLAMACQLPRSQFVGVDLVPSQIDRGKAAVAALGLANVLLDATSITDVDDRFGVFDYIICHGVYSWVPADVQNAILRICSRNLAANGVAYVSYNVYPGWHARGMLRDMILFHDEPTREAEDRVNRAREFVDALVEALPNPSSPYALAIAEQRKSLMESESSVVFHEQLEPFNTPIHFIEFATRAASHGMKYVAEAKLSHTDRRVPTSLIKAGADADDPLRAEQYSDFITGRSFRRTLLCHDSAEVAARPSTATATELHFASHSTPVIPSPADAARGPDVRAFRAPDATTVTTNNPVVVAALDVLARAAPGTLSFGELKRRVDLRLDAVATPGLAQDSKDRTEELGVVLFQCASAGLATLHRRASTFVASVSNRPVASALARYKAMTTNHVPTLRYSTVELSAFERFVLLCLDGSRTASDVVERAAQSIAGGVFGDVEAPIERNDLVTRVESVVSQFAAIALLES